MHGAARAATRTRARIITRVVQAEDARVPAGPLSDGRRRSTSRASRSRPTRPSRTGRSSGTRRRSSSSRRAAARRAGSAGRTPRGGRAASSTSARAGSSRPLARRARRDLARLGAQLRNVGRPGIALVRALGGRHRAVGPAGAPARRAARLAAARCHERVPVYGSGGFCSYRLERLARAARRLGRSRASRA